MKHIIFISNSTYVDSKDATGTTQHDRLEKSGLLLIASGGQNGRRGNGRCGREGTEVVVHHVEYDYNAMARFLDLQVNFTIERLR